MVAYPTESEEHPAEVHHFIGAPRHRLFAIFDNPVRAEQAVSAAISEGLLDGENVWRLSGEEGRHWLDLTGAGHGVHGRFIRWFQWAMSRDFGYLKRLDDALGGGAVVMSVWLPDHDTALRVGRMFRMHGGHSFAYGAHWDYTPLAA